MNESKPWWESKTLWINAIAVVAMMIQSHTGFVIDPEAQIAILGVINLILRAITRTTLDWRTDTDKIAPLLLLAVLLAGCATDQAAKQSPQAIAAKSLLSARQGVIAAATTADDLCRQGVMGQKQCDTARLIYDQAQTAYATASDALLVYVVANDETSRQKFEATQPRLMALFTDLDSLVRSFEGGK